ncbi:MAG: hypothetical protein JSR47_12450, partial [Proteobacteria bacterium]|nr:hypothetical protein [Pseudomonadota bacterium]
MAADTATSVQHGANVGASTAPAPRGKGKNLNPELFDLLHALEAMRAGDFSVRLSTES